MCHEDLGSPLPTDGLKLHHIGFVVSSIKESGQSFAIALGATWDEKIFSDPIQKVRVTFLQGHSRTDPLLELVEPDGPESPVSGFLERAGGLHHLCYELVNLDQHLVSCKSHGITVIRPPVPAVAFGGRRIAWALTKKRLLLEFLERTRSG